MQVLLSRIAAGLCSLPFFVLILIASYSLMLRCSFNFHPQRDGFTNTITTRNLLEAKANKRWQICTG